MKTKNTYFKSAIIAMLGLMFTFIANAQNFNGGTGGGFGTTTSIPIDFENINSVGDIKVDYYSLKVFPNPSDGVIEFDVDDMKNGSLKIEITDLSGRQIKIFEREINTGENLVSMDLSGLAAGLYLIRATGKSKVYLAKISIY